jgi:hypothetical protein
MCMCTSQLIGIFTVWGMIVHPMAFNMFTEKVRWTVVEKT